LCFSSFEIYVFWKNTKTLVIENGCKAR
jgi:hypothetical protein